MKETLSSKRKELFDIMIKKMPTAGRIYRIIKQQDREFIQKEKKELCLRLPLYQDAIETIIDNLAGEELINDNSPQYNYGNNPFNRKAEDKPLKKDICADCGIHISEHDRYWKNGDNFPCKKFKPLKKGCGKQFKKYWNNIDFDYLNCGEKYGVNGAFLCKACSGDENEK